MNPETIQFQCGFCRTILTVPAQMAGVSGPCPSCGQTVTSPMPAPVPSPAAAPQWPQAPTAAPVPASPPPWPPAPPSPMMGELPGGVGMQSSNLNTGLPPKRAPGQPPLSSTLNGPSGLAPWSTTPIPTPGLGPLDIPGGASGAGLPNQSRLIPGSPALPNMMPSGGPASMHGMPTIPGASLLARDVQPSPISPLSQPLMAGGAPSLSLGGTYGNDPSSSAAVAPLPAGRSIASLRAPRGTNFIRLAFAAVFLLGFLGLVGFLLKDYLPGLFPGIAGHDVAEEISKEDLNTPAKTPANSTLNPGNDAPSKLPSTGEPDTNAPLLSSTPVDKPAPSPITVGFDPKEPVPTRTATAPSEEPAANGSLRASSPVASMGAAPVNSTPIVPATGTLLEVPAKQAQNVESSGAPTSSSTSLAQTHVIEEEDIPTSARPAVEALKKFLAAGSLAERLQYTLGAEMMKPLMERYYSHAPDGPVIVDRIQFVRMDPNPELGSGKHCIFSLENKTWEFAVPVMLEEKPEGFKVDWVAFVEFKDRLLEKFFQAYQDGKARFHVGIIRHHYFEDGVPNLDHKDAFRISPAPPNSFQASVFLDKESELAQELRNRMPWETHVWAVVELEWKKLGSQQWVELSAIPQMHWYSLPMPRPISTPQKSVEAEELPPGISKNGSRNKSGGQPTDNSPPPGIRKSTPDLPTTIKRPLPAGH